MKTYKIISVCLVFLLFAAPAMAQTAEEIPINVQRLSKKVLVLTEDSPMENIIVAIASSKGLVVVDTTGSPLTAAKIREVIKQEFGRDDFAYVINTHHHWDHSWGNQVFSDAVIIGHELCREAMRGAAAIIPLRVSRLGQGLKEMKTRLDGLDPDSNEARELRKRIAFSTRNYKGLSEGFVSTLPALTFSDRLTLDLGDLTLKLIYFGRAHSGNDILIQVPEEGLLLTGDLFLERGWLPLFAGQNELDVPRWIEVLHSVLDGESQVKHVIPGHRDIWNRDKLVMWRDYIVELWEGLVTAEAEGLTLEAAEARFPLDKKFAYLKEMGYSDAELQRFQARNISAFWRQIQESAALVVEQTIAESGIEVAVAKYRKLKSLPSGEYFFDEESFNALGYRLLGQGKVKEAIEIFKLNVEAYPDSWNVYDSLGEAYMNKGDTELAIKNYKKSLELNPKNDNAKEILKRLEKIKQLFFDSGRNEGAHILLSIY